MPPAPVAPPLIEEEGRLEEETPLEERQRITLLFAGDVMAHEENYSVAGKVGSAADFAAIWDDVCGMVGAADLAFMNLEAPVADSLPFSTYPNFNMKSSYPKAALDAGFNVVSLVNNHSNDQGLAGIEESRAWAERVEEESARGSRPVHFSGLRAAGAEFSHCLIEQDGWRVLFLAVSEILNRPTCKTSLNYTEPKSEVRFAFLRYLAKLRRDNPCDLFVLSVHSSEDEYVVRVSEERRSFYREILGFGVDVVWANHPHVVRELEVYEDAQGTPRKLVMYGNGNTISGQRRDPNFASPRDIYNGRGDGLMVKAVYERDDGGLPYIADSDLVFLTTLIEGEGVSRRFVLRRLDDALVNSLRKAGTPWGTRWAAFLAVRLAECTAQARVARLPL